MGGLPLRHRGFLASTIVRVWKEVIQVKGITDVTFFSHRLYSIEQAAADPNEVGI